MLGGKLSAMNEVERKNISIAEKEYDAYKLKLISDIKSKYYEIWMIEHHTELRDEIIELLQNLLQSVEQLYTIGKTKYSDVLMIKAELASNKTQNMVFENEVSSAIYQMNSLLGRELNSSELIVFHSWQIDSLKYTAEELAEMLIYSNPDLQRMNSMIEMNRLEITANNKELIPDLMIQGMVMRMPRGMFLTTKTPMEMIDGMGETEYMYGLMASITLPFAPWTAGKYSAKEDELNTSISGLSSEKYNMQRKMISELKVMIEKLESAGMKVKLYSDEVIPLYKQTLDAQLIEFQNSRISINDLINTMQMLLMKEEEMAESKMQHQMLLAEIEAMVGRK
jgi:outer membrane protein TolC